MESEGMNLDSAKKYISAILLFFLLTTNAYSYQQRLITAIFKIDFYIIWIIGCLCWLYNLFFSSISVNRVGILTALGCGYVLILCFLNSFPDENSIYAFITLICSIGIIICLQKVFVSKYYFIVTIAILVAFFFQVCIGFLQAFENNWDSLPIKGLLYNSGFFANYMASIIPLLLSIAIAKTGVNKYLQIVISVGFALSVGLLIFTIARAAVIGVAFGCLFVIISFVKKIRIKRLIAFSFFLILFISILFASFYKIKRPSAEGRITIYEISLNIIRDHLLWGIGPNRFATVYNNYQSEFFKKGKSSIETRLIADNTFEAFNSILQVLIEYGIIGFVFLICISYQLIKYQLKKKEAIHKKWLVIGSSGCMVSVVVSSFFSNPFHVTPILLIFLYHFSVVFSMIMKPALIKRKSRFAPSFFLFSFILFTFYYAFVHYKAESNWYKASVLAKYDDFKEAEKFYEQAYPILKYGGDFLFNYGTEAYLDSNYSLSIKLLEASKKYNSSGNIFIYLGDAYTATNQFKLAEENYLHAIYTTPSHIYPKYQLISLYKKWGQLNQAKYWIRQTLQYPIKAESPFTHELVKELKEEFHP